jgi:tetratricopeptide (TPR) repeat protein
MAYGSSMGGYAAIRFASAIGAQAVLALSPQYSVDPRVIRSEDRWIEDQRRIEFLPEVERRIEYAGRIVIAYDPESTLDRLHAERIAAEVAIDPLPLPFAGHPAGTYLLETGLLRPLVRQTLSGELDSAAFTREAKRRAPTSATFLTELSATRPTVEAVALARAAVALSPDSAHVHVRLSNRLAAAGDWPAAIEVHRRALELDSGPAFRWSFANALRAARNLDEALAVTRTLQMESPTIARYHRLAADVRLVMGDLAGAVEELGEAIRCAPAAADHRRLATKLRWRLKFNRWRAGLASMPWKSREHRL